MANSQAEQLRKYDREQHQRDDTEFCNLQVLSPIRKSKQTSKSLSVSHFGSAGLRKNQVIWQSTFIQGEHSCCLFSPLNWPSSQAWVPSGFRYVGRKEPRKWSEMH